MNKPLLVVVTGRPGSGKTTLAHALAREVCCPVLSRDEIKEGFCVTHNASHTELPADTNRRIYDVFFEVVDQLLRRDISLVIEAAFQHKLWAPRLEPLQERADVRLVICRIDPAEARRRAVQRGLSNPRRERYHRDFAVHAARAGTELPLGDYDPPAVPAPTLDVDTSDDYDPPFAEIAQFTTRGRI